MKFPPLLQQKRGEKTDRSDDVYIIEGFYKDLKRNLDQLEDEDWLQQQPQYSQISYVLSYLAFLSLLFVFESTAFVMRLAEPNLISWGSSALWFSHFEKNNCTVKRCRRAGIFQ